MELTIRKDGILEINDARIIFRNFRGERSTYNKEGERNFGLVIPDQELADMLLADENRYGAAWNVKIKAPREEGETPFIHLPVKVKFNDRGPAVFLKSGNAVNQLTEDNIHRLDNLDIRSVDLDIAPYDGIQRDGTPYRSAYLRSMYVVQNVDRFTARFASEESPEE